MTGVSETTIRDAVEGLETFLRSGAEHQTLAFTVHHGFVRVKVTPAAESLSLRALKARWETEADGVTTARGALSQGEPGACVEARTAAGLRNRRPSPVP